MSIDASRSGGTAPSASSPSPRRAVAVLISSLLALLPILALFTVTATGAQAAPACPCTLFSPATVPAVVAAMDGAAVELGVAFSSDTAGYIDGIRF